MSLEELLNEVVMALEEYEAGVLPNDAQLIALYNTLCTVANVLHSIGVE